MNWYRGKDSNRGNHSNVEIDFYSDLQKATTIKEIPPFLTEKRITLLDTEPDFTWEQEKLALFWDGPSHEKPKRSNRDDLRNELLGLEGWKVLRVHYDGRPVSKAKRGVVLGWVKEVLAYNGKRRLWEYDLEKEESFI